MTKLEELGFGRDIITNFCKRHCIQVPRIINSDAIRHAGYYQFDQPDTIFINLSACDRTSRYNHPAMIYESTVIGTLLHEFGHYLHFSKFPELTKKWAKIKDEPYIKYFERSDAEDIAECIRLYILCPGRLLTGRPKHCEVLHNIFGSMSNYDSALLMGSYDSSREKIDIRKWEKFLV